MSRPDDFAGDKRIVQRGPLELAKMLASRGVVLGVENDMLRFAAAKGIIDHAELLCLAQDSGELIHALKKYPVNDGIDEARARSEEIHAPLAFSQLAHWNTYDLNRRPSACIIPSAIRLRGPVNLGALKASVLELARRHGALRTRIGYRDGSLMQLVAGGDAGHILEDLTVSIPFDAADDRIASVAADTIPNYIDLRRDPLFAFRLIRFGPKHCALVLYMEHIVSDGASVGIALRDILCFYGQRTGIGASGLRSDPLQFHDYARRQRGSQQALSSGSVAQFQEHFGGSRRVPFPSRSTGRRAMAEGWGVVSFQVGRHLVESVRRWARRARTTSVTSFFACYAAFAMRWCGVSQMTLLFQVSGREFCGAEESIGYYAFPLYLKLELGYRDNLFDLTTQVMKELYFAHEHSDCSLSESKIPRPAFTRNTCFNWLRRLELRNEFQLPWGDDLLITELGIETGNLCRIQRDTEPMMGFVETPTEITGGLYFPKERFDDAEMQECARCYLAMTSNLVQNPEIPIGDIRVQYD